MRATTGFITVLALLLVFFAPAPAAADYSAVWIVPGGGVVWPPAEFGTEDPVATFGGILGFRLSPRWAIEVRAHHASADSADPQGADTEILHGEGNLTWFLTQSKISPYLTLGAGAARSERLGETESRFAWNGGVGLRIGLSERISLRIDGRDVSYEVADRFTGEKKARHSAEVFGGVSFGFGGKPPDEDLDGVDNKTDKCPGTPRGARVDATGCPIDGDGDGVFDGLDQCEGTPQGCTVDATGCQTDADKDGVCDGIDTCADTPAGAQVDAAGCPRDSDGDGVPNGLDQCESTGKGCVVNPNGCPTDGDQDGVCDGIDKCPDTPANVRVDVGGCPIQVSIRETELLETGMIRLQDVNFDTGKATIKAESQKVLDEVANILLRWPQLRIEIGGHTDSRGSEALNQRLGNARAKAVLDYLASKFPELHEDQFTSKGYGESQPIATNSTTLGMAKNRRVEFKVLNTEALKKETQKQQFVPKE